MHIPPPQPDRHRTIVKDTIIPQPRGSGVHTISVDVTGGTTGHRHHNPPLSHYPRQSMQEESGDGTEDTGVGIIYVTNML